jgi:hypothetical protein
MLRKGHKMDKHNGNNMDFVTDRETGGGKRYITWRILDYVWSIIPVTA